MERSDKGSYVDTFKTDWIDKKIKNSFSSTTDLLTKAYSRSMPDISSIEIPKRRSSLAEIQQPQPVNDSMAKLPVAEQQEYHKREPAYEESIPLDLFKQHSLHHDALKERRLMNLYSIQDPKRGLSDRNLKALSDKNQSVGDPGVQDSLRDDEYFNKFQQKRERKSLSISEEYQKNLREMKMNESYNRAFSLYNTGQLHSDQTAQQSQPFYKRLSKDSLESFRFNDNVSVKPPSINSTNSAEHYSTSRKFIENDRPLSEPIKTDESQHIPSIKPFHSYYDSYVLRNAYLIDQPRKTHESTTLQSSVPIYMQSSYLSKNHPSQNAVSEPHHQNAQMEVYHEETEEKNEEDYVTDNQMPIYGHIYHNGGYAAIAERRKEMKAKMNKRVKRKVEPKEGDELQKDDAGVPDHFLSNPSDSSEPTTEVDAMESNDHEKEKPKQILPNYNFLSSYPYLRKSLLNSLPHTGYYSQEEVDPNRPDQFEWPMYGNKEEGKSDVQRYFTPLKPSHDHSLPPLNHNGNNGVSATNDLITANAVDEDSAKRNKVLRQKEYAELLRQHKREMGKEKPQVRSWNIKATDNVSENSKRALALEYASTVPKPTVLREQNRLSDDRQPEREKLFDAIEIMKQRHVEEKKAIEEIRAQIQQQISRSDLQQAC